MAEWTYDTLKPGLLTESKSYLNGDTTNPYIQRVTGYDAYARPTGEQTIIPASQGALAGTYARSQTYTSTGQVATQTLPAMGGLPAETITTGYSNEGLANSTVGDKQYVNSTARNPYGAPSQVIGHEGNTLSLTTNYDSETLNIESTYFNGAVVRPQIQYITYTRNQAGMITKTSTAMNFNNPAAVRTMCYDYDTRARLTQAWTSTNNCGTQPTSTNSVTGNIMPIWYQWTYNDAGARTKETRNKVPNLSAPTTTTTYAIGTPGQKHATASETVNNGTSSTTTNYTYDASGNTTSAVTGTVVENLAWDAQGSLLSTTKGTASTSYIRDADGNIIVRKDPAGTTIYTAAGELRLTGTTTKTGTRFYSHAGQTVAQRVGTTLQAINSDHTGTATVAVDWADISKTTWRWMDPFGNPLSKIGNWTSDHGYLNVATDASTGYIQMGARIYNPRHGRFLSVDPVLSHFDTGSLNGYSYTSADPINTHDSSGLYFERFHQNPDSGYRLQATWSTGPGASGVSSTTSREVRAGGGATRVTTKHSYHRSSWGGLFDGKTGKGRGRNPISSPSPSTKPSVPPSGPGVTWDPPSIDDVLGWATGVGAAIGGWYLAAQGTATTAVGVATEVAKTSLPTMGAIVVGWTADMYAAKGGDPAFWAKKEFAETKIPKHWTDKPNKKAMKNGVFAKDGWRWEEPGSKGGQTVRLDRGDPNNSQETQQVDHVRINSGGKMVGRDGTLYATEAAKQVPKEVHIPYTEWITWSAWNKP